MAENSGKGSIFLKLIIVVLVVVLAGAIVIPKRMWDEEEKNTEVCHQRMASILAAELLHQKYTDTYIDDLDSLLKFFTDDLEKYESDFVGLDTMLNVAMMDLVKEDSIAKLVMDTLKIDSMMTDVMKSIDIDYFLSVEMCEIAKRYNLEMRNVVTPLLEENEGDKMAGTIAIKALTEDFTLYEIATVMKKSDSLYSVIRQQFEPVMTMVDYLTALKAYPNLRGPLDSLYNGYIDSLVTCPTVHKPYQIVVSGSVIVFSNVYCPIDSLDSLAVENNWYKKKIGGMTLENHGKVENGELSWQVL
ncbi:hypothetical protein KAH55_12995 [bacterium]|nr:hypothetical protein [bacterium]